MTDFKEDFGRAHRALVIHPGNIRERFIVAMNYLCRLTDSGFEKNKMPFKLRADFEAFMTRVQGEINNDVPDIKLIQNTLNRISDEEIQSLADELSALNERIEKLPPASF